MINLKGQDGELRFTVSVTRKETGETETYEMVGKVTKEQAEELETLGFFEDKKGDK